MDWIDFINLHRTEPQKSVLTMINNLISGAVCKIFKVSDKDVICDIRHSTAWRRCALQRGMEGF